VIGGANRIFYCKI